MKEAFLTVPVTPAGRDFTQWCQSSSKQEMNLQQMNWYSML
jgi:hypothetical protein